MCFRTPPVKNSLDEQTPGGSEGLARNNQFIEDAGAEYRKGQHIFQHRQQSSDCNPSKVATYTSGGKGRSTSPPITRVAPISDSLLQNTENILLGCDSIPDGISNLALS
ncbi:hypothetical protein Aspvir_001730, partial [Aspergillus viridinutans]